MNIDFRPLKDFNKIENIGDWKCMDDSSSADISFNWLETDIIPLSDNSVDNIYTSCILSFIYPSKILYMIKEFYRVTKEYGRIRICVPDFELGIKYYMEDRKMLFKKRMPSSDLLPPTALGVLQLWGSSTPSPDFTYYKYTRRISFDFESLMWYLSKAGFVGINRREHNDCSKVFVGRDYEPNQLFVLYVEATKPISFDNYMREICSIL